VPALIALVLGTLLTVRLGVAVAHRLPSRTLATLFATFLVLNGAHLLYSTLVAGPASQQVAGSADAYRARDAAPLPNDGFVRRAAARTVAP